jgi:hypothetical protein
MVKTDIIINDEEYEFAIIASNIEKFKKDYFYIHGLQNRVWVWTVW